MRGGGSKIQKVKFSELYLVVSSWDFSLIPDESEHPTRRYIIIITLTLNIMSNMVGEKSTIFVVVECVSKLAITSSRAKHGKNSISISESWKMINITSRAS